MGQILPCCCLLPWSLSDISNSYFLLFHGEFINFTCRSINPISTTLVLQELGL
jgi:hypothetical protein